MSQDKGDPRNHGLPYTLYCITCNYIIYYILHTILFMWSIGALDIPDSALSHTQSTAPLGMADAGPHDLGLLRRVVVEVVEKVAVRGVLQIVHYSICILYMYSICYMYMYIYIYTHMYMYMYIHIHACIYICTCMYIYIYSILNCLRVYTHPPKGGM